MVIDVVVDIIDKELLCLQVAYLVLQPPNLVI